MKHRKRTAPPLPAGMRHHSTFTAPDRQEWEQGEYVWVEGWPHRRTSRHRIHRIVERNGNIDVQVWYEHRGIGQIHSVAVDRLRKRRQSVVESMA